MLTPQEIAEKKFDKVMVWGYDMNAVDSFLGTVEADYAQLYKENIALKSKMKVLIAKIDEYRKVDESMRKTLLDAQTMASEIVERAKRESETRERQADEEVSRKLGELTGRIAAEEQRLEEAKTSAQAFIERVMGMYAREQENLTALRDREFAGYVMQSAGLSAEEPIMQEDELLAVMHAREQDNRAQRARDAAPELQRSEPVIQNIPDIPAAPAAPAEPAASAELEAPVVAEAPAEPAERASLEDTVPLPELNQQESSTEVFETEPEEDAHHRPRPTPPPSTMEDEDGETIMLTPKPRFNFDNLQFGDQYREEQKK